VQAIAIAKEQCIERSAELHAVLTELDSEIGQLRTAERYLADARSRGEQIERELECLRSLEQTLRDQERLRAEATARVEALQAEVAAAQRDEAQAQQELEPRLQALQLRLSAARAVEQALQTAEQSVAESLQTLTPPAAAGAADQQ
jgi:chromosome segregation ATPase